MRRGLMLRWGCCGLGLLLALGLLASCAGKQQARQTPPEHTGSEQPRQAAPVAPAVEVLPTATVQAEDIFPYPPLLDKAEDVEPWPRARGLESRLAEISREVAGKIHSGLGERGGEGLASRVAVVVAVPLSDLKRESEFGRVMAEYLLTDLADRGLAVVELRLGRDIQIVPQTGEFILSRNTGELAGDQPEPDYVVVSTYSNTRRTLMVYGRLVDLKNGQVGSSWRYNLPLTRELLGLFRETEEPFTIAVRDLL